MNSIAAYCIAHLFEGFIHAALLRHVGQDVLAALGAAYETFLLGACVLLVYWLILYWMYHMKVFLRI
jgi:heparan-alpha-glucosaminide N-acetyltransferase